MSSTKYEGKIYFNLLKQESYEQTDIIVTVKLSSEGLFIDIPSVLDDDAVVLFISLNTFSKIEFATLNYFLYMFKLQLVNFDRLNLQQIILEQTTQSIKIINLQLYTHIDLYCARIGLNPKIIKQNMEEFVKNDVYDQNQVICLSKNPALQTESLYIEYQELVFTGKQNEVQQNYNQSLAVTAKIVAIQSSVAVDIQSSVQKHKMAYVFAVSAFMLITPISTGDIFQQINLNTNNYFQNIEDLYQSKLNKLNYKAIQSANFFRLPLHFYELFIQNNPNPQQLFVMFKQLFHVSFAFKPEYIAIQSNIRKLSNGIMAQSQNSGKTVTMLTQYYYFKILHILKLDDASPVYIDLKSLNIQENIYNKYLSKIPISVKDFDLQMKDFVNAGYQLHCDMISKQNFLLNYIKCIHQQNVDQIGDILMIETLRNIFDVKKNSKSLCFDSQQWIFYPDISKHIVDSKESYNIYLLIDESLIGAKQVYYYFIKQITKFTQALYSQIIQISVNQQINYQEKMSNNKSFSTSISILASDSLEDLKIIPNSNTENKQSSSQLNLFSSRENSNTQQSQNIYQNVTLNIGKNKNKQNTDIGYQSNSSIYEESYKNQVIFDVNTQLLISLYCSSPICFKRNDKTITRDQFKEYFKNVGDYKHQLYKFCLELYNPRVIETYIIRNLKDTLTSNQQLETISLKDYLKHFFTAKKENNQSYSQQFQCFSIYASTDLSLINSIKFHKYYNKSATNDYIHFQLVGQAQFIPSQLEKKYYTESSIFQTDFSDDEIKLQIQEAVDLFDIALFFFIIQPEITLNLQLVTPFITPALFFRIKNRLYSYNSVQQYKLNISNSGLTKTELTLYLIQNLESTFNGLKLTKVSNKYIYNINQNSGEAQGLDNPQYGTNNFFIAITPSLVNQKIVSKVKQIILKKFCEQLKLVDQYSIKQFLSYLQVWFSKQQLTEIIYMLEFIFYLIKEDENFKTNFKRLFAFYLPIGYQVHLQNMSDFEIFRKQTLNAELIINQVQYDQSINQINDNEHYFTVYDNSDIRNTIQQELNFKLPEKEFLIKVEQLLSNCKHLPTIQFIRQQSTFYQFRQNMFKDSLARCQELLIDQEANKILIVTVFDVTSMNILLNRKGSVPDFMFTLFERDNISQEFNPPVIYLADSGLHTTAKIIDKSYQDKPIIEIKPLTILNQKIIFAWENVVGKIVPVVMVKNIYDLEIYRYIFYQQNQLIADIQFDFNQVQVFDIDETNYQPPHIQVISDNKFNYKVAIKFDQIKEAVYCQWQLKDITMI